MRRCPFHRVEPSPYPFYVATSLWCSAVGFVLFLHGDSSFVMWGSLGLTVLCVAFWLSNIVYEATFLGKHTKRVQRGIVIGFGLFMSSEVMFFVSFFWAFFHSSLAPGMEVGFMWPPQMEIMKFTGVPLANTALLIGTVVPCNLALKCLRAAALDKAMQALGGVITMGLGFVFLQGWEYKTAKFTIADSVYGSTFFSLTGLHGLHVVGGLLFLSVALFRMYRGHFSSARHLNVNFAIWYWHFVDVVWVFVYGWVYIWGGYGWSWDVHMFLVWMGVLGPDSEHIGW